MQSSFIQKGFTLVELLIVVIILAILAAIVVPQFTNTAEDANISALDSNLANIRSVIDMYAQQHGGNFPAAVADTACAGVTGAGADTEGAFINQLAFYSNAMGGVCNLRTDSGISYPLGPYLSKPEIPANPITGSAVVAIATTGDLTMAGAGAGLGWRYDTDSGRFIANDTNLDPSGNGYDTH